MIMKTNNLQQEVFRIIFSRRFPVLSQDSSSFSGFEWIQSSYDFIATDSLMTSAPYSSKVHLLLSINARYSFICAEC